MQSSGRLPFAALRIDEVEARSIRVHCSWMRTGGSVEPWMRDLSLAQDSRPIASTGWRIEVRGGLTACIQE